eukprot:g6440.t1
MVEDSVGYTNLELLLNAEMQRQSLVASKGEIKRWQDVINFDEDQPAWPIILQIWKASGLKLDEALGYPISDDMEELFVKPEGGDDNDRVVVVKEEKEVEGKLRSPEPEESTEELRKGFEQHKAFRVTRHETLGPVGEMARFTSKPEEFPFQEAEQVMRLGSGLSVENIVGSEKSRKTRMNSSVWMRDKGCKKKGDAKLDANQDWESWGGSKQEDRLEFLPISSRRVGRKNKGEEKCEGTDMKKKGG